MTSRKYGASQRIADSGKDGSAAPLRYDATRRIFFRLFILCALVVVPTSACDAQNDSAGEDIQVIMLHDGGNRVYDLHIPDGVGEEDAVLPFEGVSSGPYATMSVHDAFLFWRNAFNCPFGTERITDEHSGIKRDIRTTPSCREGARVRMDALKRVGHGWPPFGPGEIADFFDL